MTTVQFSVPDDIAKAFNADFKPENQDTVISNLMREAIAKAQQQRRSAAGRILARRRHAPTISVDDFRAAREEGRP